MPSYTTLTLENSRQMTLHEFYDLGIQKPAAAIRLEWERGYNKIMKYLGEKDE